MSLGSSRCLQCPTYWPGLFVLIVIVFTLSGIGLVVLLLVLNLTVAIGTLNAVIFYANIMTVTKRTFFSSSEVSFTSVFISWLNFDLGVDTCFLMESTRILRCGSSNSGYTDLALIHEAPTNHNHSILICHSKLS